MVFQDPMTSLNPLLSVGTQVGEAIRIHRKTSRRSAWQQAIELLQQVGISSPTERAHAYPHELSGGMRQRAMIAMALACGPSLLIADEPTTALDVTIQAQILELIRDLCRERRMSVILITHDLGVVAENCERVLVMYAGRIVERAPVAQLFSSPRHPYTAGLLASLPSRVFAAEALTAPRRLYSIPGSVPNLMALPSGCRFRDRCERAIPLCAEVDPLLELKSNNQWAACHNPVEPL
jgi:peptide/nickel transport system ATP-binding protein